MQVLYSQADGSKLVYESEDKEIVYGYVIRPDGKQYPTMPVESILARGYWEESEDVLKHEQHDQSTHGSWANGSRGSDITDDCKSYFGTDVMGYQTSEAKREIQKRTDRARIMGRGHENYILEIVAEKQGFAEKPKVVSSDEIDQLEKDGWTVAYRGVKDYRERGADSVKWEAERLAEEFRTGNYHAGSGTDGDGLYFTTNRRVAVGYAGPEGKIIKVAIPPSSTLTPDQFNDEIKSHREKISKGGVGDFWGADDIGVSLASKGVRGAQSKRMMGFGGFEAGRARETVEADVFVIWDRSMLAVEEGKSK
jgi:hypothetical protein